MIFRISCTAALLGSAALSSSPAFSQASAQPLAEDEGQARDGNEVIVTAQKIEQRAQDVPITISAITGQRIAELGVGDLDELSNYVPGLNIREQSANSDRHRRRADYDPLPLGIRERGRER